MHGPPLSQSRAGPVLTVLMQRPETANALNGALRTALATALREAADDPGTGIVVLGGAGRMFCAGADLRAPPAADDAALVAPFSQLGLIPDGGATWLLVQQLGYRRAYQLAIEAELIDARRALECGLVNRVEPSDRLLEHTQRWAAELAERSPVALSATKQSMRFAAESGYFATYAEEERLQARCAASPDFREGVAAYLAKRRPQFRRS